MASVSRAAAHEAGHVLVGSAVGRRPVLVRIGGRAIENSDPLIRHLGAGAIIGGSTLFEIGLLDEVNERTKVIPHAPPLEPRHIEWLRADLVASLAGFVAEEELIGEIADASAKADEVDAVRTAAKLQAAGEDGSAQVVGAMAIVREVIADLRSEMEAVADAFSSGPPEFDETAIGEILTPLGLQFGSHRALLSRLESGPAKAPADSKAVPAVQTQPERNRD
jgi:hypothetical protein